MSKRLWILGAPDPEMQKIEELLTDAGEEFIFAGTFCPPSTAFTRVHPGNAYQAAPVDGATHWVECAPAEGHPAGAVVIDHHRPGDPGYGRGPAEFMAASSIGQVLAELARMGWRPLQGEWVAGPPDREDEPAESAAWEWWGDGPSASHHLRAIWPSGADELVAFGGPPVILTAAADHCLAAAYGGQCPGVAPDDLRAFRAAQRGTFLSTLPADRPERMAVAHWHRHLTDQVSEEIWIRSVKATWAAGRTDLEGRPMARLDLTPESEDWGEDTEAATARYVLVRDLRDRVLPEAPEVLAQAGECGIYLLLAQGGRPAKLGVIGAGEGTIPGTAPVEAFLSAARAGNVAGTAVDPSSVYGDPARGYAGATVAAD